MGVGTVLAVGLKKLLTTKKGEYVFVRDGKMYLDGTNKEVSTKELSEESLAKWKEDNTLFRGDNKSRLLAPEESHDTYSPGHQGTHMSYDRTHAAGAASYHATPISEDARMGFLHSSNTYAPTAKLLDYKADTQGTLSAIADATAKKTMDFDKAPRIMDDAMNRGDWDVLEDPATVANIKVQGSNIIRQGGEADNVHILPGGGMLNAKTEPLFFGSNILLKGKLNKFGELENETGVPQELVKKYNDTDSPSSYMNGVGTGKDSFVFRNVAQHGDDSLGVGLTSIVHGGISSGLTKDQIIKQMHTAAGGGEGGRGAYARESVIAELQTIPTKADGQTIDQEKIPAWLKQTSLYGSAGVLGIGLASQSEDTQASEETKFDDKGNPYTSRKMSPEEYNQFLDSKAGKEAARMEKKGQPQFMIDNAVAEIQAKKLTPEQIAKSQEPAREPTEVEKLRANGLTDDVIYKLYADEGKTQAEIDQAFDGTLSKAREIAAKQGDHAMFDQQFGYAPHTNAKTLELPELTAQLEKLNRIDWQTGKGITSLWDDKTAKEVEEYTSAIQPKLVEGLLKRGMQAKLMVREGDVMRDAKEGEVPNTAAVLDPKTNQFVPATSDIVSSLTSSALTITGGIAGAASGVELGLAAPIPHPLGKAAAVAGGAIIGGAVGTFTGSVADDLVTAAKLNEDFDAQKAVRFAAQEGLTSAIFDAGLVGLMKSPQAVAKLASITKRYIEDANVAGAYRALKDITGVTDQQADEYIKQVNAMSKAPLEGSTTRQRIAAVAQTQKGAEVVVPQASQLSKSGGFNYAKEIDTRAKDFTAAVDAATPDNLGKLLTDDLGKYQQSVRDGYEGVKSFGINQADSVGYHFDIDEFKIDSMLEDASVRITDPAVLAQFDNLMSRVQAIGAASPTGAPRSFSDLLDLRKTISDFKYKNNTNNYIKLDRVNQVLNSIDQEIESAASVMPNGKQWFEEFSKSKVDYAQMKALEKNALYKSLTRPGVNADQIVTAVSQKAGSIDGTFMEVLGKLPQQTRVNVEGAVMKHMLQKHTLGDAQSYQAIDFPALVQQLDGLQFTTVQNRELKRVAQEFARVFRNDKALAQAAGAVNVPKPTSYLATSVEGRMRVQAMSEFFGVVSKYIPTKEGRVRSLADKVADVLDNPTNAKATQQLLSDLPDDPGLKEGIQRLAIEYTKRGQKETYPKVALYQVHGANQTRDPRVTRLGKGLHYFTDETKAKAYASGQGLSVKAVQMEPSRFATPAQIEQLTGEPFNVSQLRKLEVLSALRAKGYTGVAEGDEVLEFSYRTP